jgi:hypothetical protein
MKTIHIPVHVDQVCIDYGIAINNRACPVALACISALFHAGLSYLRPMISTDGVTIVDNREGGLRLAAVTEDKKIAAFVEDFDRHLPVEPFKFVMKLSIQPHCFRDDKILSVAILTA